MFGSAEEAEARARSLLLEVRLNGACGDAQSANDAAPCLSDVAEHWARDQQVRVDAGKKRQSSLVTNLYQLAPIVKAFGHLPIDQLNRRRQDAYQAARRKEGRAPETINAELATLGQVQAWAVEQGLVSKVVSTDRLPVDPKDPLVLTPAEAVALLENIPDRIRPFVRLLMETGCRFGEAAHLRWEQVDLERGEARIERRADWGPKSRYSIRTLLLSPALCADLAERQGAPDQYVFESRKRGRPIDDIRKSMRAATQAANITRRGKLANVRPKDLRACFATWQASSGVRERIVQSLLGHAPGTKVTKRHYEHTTRPEEEAATSALWLQLGSASGLPLDERQV
ncbi:tyrosine-type recombinase/integrase [Brevundimonas bacteroides]|uniref:tyrosine-type recombinase/integrase n=1 Tax=Brevundimonas bacteroides TaxID=74311 RepID=UPI000555761E|nr:site-specific integrase [Brevundimonas bacteroides]